MPVKNVECQLAEMQIGRYVSGETLSSEALRQLEAHVAGCSSCSRVLAERRKALNSMLTHGFAAVSTDLPADNKENLLIKALKEKADMGTSKKAPRPTAQSASPYSPKNDFSSKMAALMGGAKSTSTNTNKSLYKPVIYSAALAVVLLAMGYLTRGQGSILGDSAESAFPYKAENVASTSLPTASKEVKHSPEPAKAPSEAPKKDKPASPSPNPLPSSRVDKVGAGEGAKPVKAPEKEKISIPLDSSSSENDANEPQPPIRHSQRRTSAAQERWSHHRLSHRAVSHRPVSRIHVYKASDIQIYDASGNPLRS